MSSNKLIIATIILLAAVLRLYKLDSHPVSISWDEAAIGYNAYSIAQTAKDEYGKKFPLLFQSFNDYKLPGYIYLDAALIKAFGFSDTTVRLPSALTGILAILALYLLVKNLFNQKIALIAAALAAISPWHLQFSRAAFESNVSLTIVLFGAILLIYGLKNKFAAVVSMPVLFLSLYFYYFPRIFIPLILIGFFFLWRKEVVKNFKLFLISFLVAIIIALPLIPKIISSEGAKRVKEVSVFSRNTFAEPYVQTRVAQNLPLENIYLNQRIPYVIEALKNYASHFSPKFFFFAEDPNPRHRTPYHGNFYLFETVAIILGLLIFIKFKDSKSRNFLLIWLLFAPISAAFAVDSPHSLRALLMLPPLLIISAFGVGEILKKPLLKIILPIVIVLFFLNYLINYYLVYPLKDSTSWAYGYKQLFRELKSVEQNADSIIVTGHFWKPYIFYLYYNKIDPSFYHKSGTLEKIGKYHFGTTYWDSGGRDLEEEDIEKLKGQKTIVVLSPGEFENINDKTKFKDISIVTDYSGRTTLFRIGEWQ